MTDNYFVKLHNAIVDGKKWYTIVIAGSKIWEWLRTQPKDHWASHSSYSMIDLSEELLIIMSLKFKESQD